MSEWISVRERMPSDSTSVLVWCPERKNKYTACWISPNWIHFGGSFDKKVGETVTHWMPTPDGPLTWEDRVIVQKWVLDPSLWIVLYDDWNVSNIPGFKDKRDAEIFRLGLIETLKKESS